MRSGQLARASDSAWTHCILRDRPVIDTTAGGRLVSLRGEVLLIVNVQDDWCYVLGPGPSVGWLEDWSLREL